MSMMLYSYEHTDWKIFGGGDTRIEIETSEDEQKFIKERIINIHCERNSGHRMVKIALDPLCIFSREDVRLLAQMIRRIDGIVETYVTDMLPFPGGLCRDFRKRYIAPDENRSPKKKGFRGYSYDWYISDKSRWETKDEISWPYLRHTLKEMTVGIGYGDWPDYKSPEKWEIAGKPKNILLTAEGIIQADDETAMQPSAVRMPALVFINGMNFNGETGMRLLKLQHTTCPYPEWQEAWDSVEPLRFRDITRLFKDHDRRRMAIRSLGIDRLIPDIETTLVKAETMEKITSWVDTDGNTHTRHFTGTYSLHRVRWDTLFSDAGDTRIDKTRPHHPCSSDLYFVKFRDTTTDREYINWVNLRDVHFTNHPDITRDMVSALSQARIEKMSSPINAIAWTIETTLAKGSIEAIIRQGNCILVRPVNEPVIVAPRRLTGEEYRTLLRVES
jgi:hypothetical protein